eukprot:CAMPEP_0172454262 /NCGR_PEP_ID=MMETSP1065-20121228/11302_1 /TAXON_ID=265537 /ORGANISM="Amphiprora paludosa, Strain CCMP125" /LENGTH=114 /DNA_ID=CAMNT_0013206559 /DNA_START=355 /DNA_END=699 /DNA_ORIENTATION=+
MICTRLLELMITSTKESVFYCTILVTILLSHDDDAAVEEEDEDVDAVKGICKILVMVISAKDGSKVKISRASSSAVAKHVNRSGSDSGSVADGMVTHWPSSVPTLGSGKGNETM